MAEKRAAAVLQTLKDKLAMPKWGKSKLDPYETLVKTILSQNTADRNTARAFENLSKQFEMTSESLANADVSQIESAIKAAGLYRNKAKAIQRTSKIIFERYAGTLQPILSLPFEEARAALLELPGIGPKTADVVLLFSAHQGTLPVDTHVNRVAKRLGFAPADGNYEDVRASLQRLFDPSEYFEVHILLIAHGRKYCKARHPLCTECPICILCPTCGEWDGK